MPAAEDRTPLAPDVGTGASAVGKSRKRVFPALHTPEPNPLSEAYGYCNTPNHSEQAWEGEKHTYTQDSLPAH